MAVKNFIPALWATKILKEMDKKQVLIKNCNTEFSGEISGIGDSVTINNIMTPTIGTYVAGTTNISPEEIMDESRKLVITESKYFAIALEKIDKKQATKGILEEAMRKASIGLKNVAEQFIGLKYDQAGTIVTATITSGNILSTLQLAKTALEEQNLEDSDIVLEVTPAVWAKIVLAGIVYTDSGSVMTSGSVSPVLGIQVFKSNNLSKASTLSHCMMRSKRAIAFAEQIVDVKKYEPEARFSEAVKGLHVYGAKVILPMEMVDLELTVASETVI